MAQKVHESISTPLRWYQTKRLPLYFVVGGTFAGGQSVDEGCRVTCTSAFWLWRGLPMQPKA